VGDDLPLDPRRRNESQCKIERELRGPLLSRLGLWVGELGGRSGIRLPLGFEAAVLSAVLAFQDQVSGDVEKRME